LSFQWCSTRDVAEFRGVRRRDDRRATGNRSRRAGRRLTDPPGDREKQQPPCMELIMAAKKRGKKAAKKGGRKTAKKGGRKTAKKRR